MFFEVLHHTSCGIKAKCATATEEIGVNLVAQVDGPKKVGSPGSRGHPRNESSADGLFFKLYDSAPSHTPKIRGMPHRDALNVGYALIHDFPLLTPLGIPKH